MPETRLAKYITSDSQLEVSMLLTDDKKIRELNRIYRKKDKATNVLSFPIGDNLTKSIKDLLPIGDIVLSYQTINKLDIINNHKWLNFMNYINN